MGTYRICKTFRVESGHMLSKHPEACRYPHGHSRTMEVVVSSKQLNENDMVLDFKALKHAIEDYVDLFDHSMAINSEDPLRKVLEKQFPEGVVVFEETDPTTEVFARDLFEFVDEILKKGWKTRTKSGIEYEIPAGRVKLERVRVSETASSWAEYGRD